MSPRSCFACVLVPVLGALPALAQAPVAPREPVDELVVERELAGRSLSAYPWFDRVLAFNEGAPVEVAVDTGSHPELVGEEFPLFVVRHRRAREWDERRELVDVRGGPQDVVLREGGLKANTFTIDTGRLSGQTGTTEVGVGYDVVLDRDRSGTLSRGDWIDGLGRTAGFYVLADLTQPGPHATVEVLFNGGGFQKLDVYYPADIGSLGRLPLVFVGHGNGHDYQWYDHIGNHLGSWGHVVVSYANNTGPGIKAASVTTLANTEYFLANLDVIAGGALQEHVDPRRIVWIGHSRGGEGIVLAYEKLRNGSPLATLYSAEDIRLLSAIAPTDFKRVHPGRAPFHLWTGGADRDVNGCANCNICQTFHLFERAPGPRMSISLHGVGHGDFHDGGGSSVAQGPCLVGRPDTHRIMRGVLLPLLKSVLAGNAACEEYLWRQWEDLRPIGAPDENPCVVVDLQYQAGPGNGRLVVDDFQEGEELGVSSSGGRVSTSMDELYEDRLNDRNNSFTPMASDPMNGMTQAGGGDESRGLVFLWDRADEWLLFEVAGAPRDLRAHRYLSFRATQTTRDVLTEASQGDLTFGVRLWDAHGRQSTISIGAYGGGIEEPYRRGSCGVGNGWANEWETVRIALEDFRADGSGLDLGAVVALEFLFGPSHGSPEGRIGLDEIELLAR